MTDLTLSSTSRLSRSASAMWDPPLLLSRRVHLRIVPSSFLAFVAHFLRTRAFPISVSITLSNTRFVKSFASFAPVITLPVRSVPWLSLSSSFVSDTRTGDILEVFLYSYFLLRISKAHISEILKFLSRCFGGGTQAMPNDLRNQIQGELVYRSFQFYKRS